MRSLLEALNDFFSLLPYPSQRDVAPDVSESDPYIMWAVTNDLPDDEQGNYADDMQGVRVDLRVHCWAETGGEAADIHDLVESTLRSVPITPTGWKQIRRPYKLTSRPVRDQDGRHHQVVSEWYLRFTRA